MDYGNSGVSSGNTYNHLKNNTINMLLKNETITTLLKFNYNRMHISESEFSYKSCFIEGFVAKKMVN